MIAYCGLNNYVTLSNAEYSWCVLFCHDTLSDWLQYKFNAMLCLVRRSWLWQHHQNSKHGILIVKRHQDVHPIYNRHRHQVALTECDTSRYFCWYHLRLSLLNVTR